MDNYRFYLVDIDKLEDNFDVIKSTNEEFMDKSEEQGLVYTHKSFELAFNSGDINQNNCQLRIININSITQ